MTIYAVWAFTRKQIWPCHKNGHSQPSAIIWTNLVVYTYLSTRCFRPSKSSASWFRRRIFFKIFTIYGHGSHLGHVIWNILTNFHPNIPWRLPTSHGGSIWKMASNNLVFFCLRKRSLKMLNLSALHKDQWMTFTLGKSYVLTYLTIRTNFHLTGFNCFWEI